MAFASDEWVIVPANAIGDAFFACALSSAFVARHGGRRVLVALPRAYRGLVELFPDAPLAPLSPEEVDAPLRATRGFAPGEPFPLDPMLFVRDFEAAYAGRTIPFTRAYHDVLDLPFPSFERPRVPDALRAAAARRLAAAGLPEGRTALLVPFARSLAMFSRAFWTALASALAARGWAVATNVAPHEADRAIPGTTPLASPIHELFPIAELAGLVIASRCGVVDLLAAARTDLRILYHRPQYDWKPAAGVTLGWDPGPAGLGEGALSLRMGADEEVPAFVARVLDGR